MDRLQKLLNDFISGVGVSVSAANELEVLLDDEFTCDEFMQDTVLMLASYRPEGGEYLYDKGQMIERLRKVKKRLDFD